VQNKFLGIFIVFFFSGTLSSLIFRLLDSSVFRNTEFKMQDWAYGNLLILLTSVLATYIWVTKNKT
tara:strand:- start:564 stop:761 length:198 start_codon:yes stop_codon:yes gene_type:complete